MKKNGLRYQIGQINGWNEVVMQVDNVFVEQMRRLNEEEKEIRRNYDEEKMEDFYQRKNELALKFIQAVNNGEIQDENIGIVYLENDLQDMYWDKILIDINRAYSEDRYVQYKDSFVILPPIIASMDNGEEILYDFLKSHVKEKYNGFMMDEDDIEEWNSMQFSNSMFDWQLPIEDIQSTWELEVRTRNSEEDLEKYKEILPEEEAKKVKETIETYPKALEQSLLKNMKTYNLSREQTLTMENYLRENRDKWKNKEIPKVKRVISKLIKDYGEDWVIKHEAILEMNYSLIKGDMSNLEENIYKARKRDGNGEGELISTLKLENKIIEKILHEEDAYELIALASNKSITIAQARELRKKELEPEEKYQLLCNLAESGILLEEDIRDMYNGSEDERKAVLNYSSNLPNDLIGNEIDNVVELFDKFVKEGNKQNVNMIFGNGMLLHNALKNNSKVPLTMIEKYYDCIKQMMEVKTEYMLRDMSAQSMGAIFAQENLDENLIREMANKYARTCHYYGAVEDDVVYQYFKNPQKYPDLIDVFVNSEDEYVREEVAKAYLDGRCEKLDKEIVNKLARDPKIKMDVRLQLQKKPEYEEVFSKEKKNIDFEYNYTDYTTIDMRTYFINGKEIMNMRTRHPMYIEDFERLCEEHREAITFILENETGTYSREQLTERIGIIENLLQKEEKITDDEKKFIEEVIENAKEKKELETTKEKATNLLQEYQKIDKNQNKGQSLDE